MHVTSRCERPMSRPSPRGVAPAQPEMLTLSPARTILPNEEASHDDQRSGPGTRRLPAGGVGHRVRRAHRRGRRGTSRRRHLELLAIATYLAGRDDDSAAALERAHQQHLREDNPERAALCAFWLSMALVMRGETARGGGWVARGQRLVEEHDLDGPERGYLLLPSAFQALFGGGGAGGGVRDLRAGHRDRRAHRRARPGGAGPARTGPVADHARRPGDRHRPARRGDDRGHRRRGRADRQRAHLLRRHRDLPRHLRPASRRASGPPRSATGARPSPSSSPTAASAWCTAPR